MSSHQLPDDIVATILSRVAVKDLLRFRCVRKSWCALINSSYFVKKHLKQYNETSDSLNLIVRDLYTGVYKVNLDDDVFDKYNAVKVNDHPFNPPSIINCLVGSCNGLICLSSADNRVAIWNPSTKKSHVLPVMPIEFGVLTMAPQTPILHGFGYDHISDDYKVIGLAQIFQDLDLLTYLGTVARVYSLKAKSWTKKSRELPVNQHPYGNQRATFITSTSNALLHWAMQSEVVDWDNQPFLIAAFDLGVDDGYHEVQQPDYKIKHFDISLGVLRGCLCIFTFRLSSCNLWVMKEYGVKESWTKLISIANQPYQWDYKKPIVYSRCGHKILLQDYYIMKFIWYDLKNKTVTVVELPGLEHPLCVGEVCLQSLVSV